MFRQLPKTIIGGCVGRAIPMPLSCWLGATRKAARNATNTGLSTQIHSITAILKCKCSTTHTIPTGSSPNWWCHVAMSSAWSATSTLQRGLILVLFHHKLWWHLCAHSENESNQIDGPLWFTAQLASEDQAHSSHWIDCCNRSTFPIMWIFSTLFIPCAKVILLKLSFELIYHKRKSFFPLLQNVFGWFKLSRSTFASISVCWRSSKERRIQVQLGKSITIKDMTVNSLDHFTSFSVASKIILLWMKRMKLSKTIFDIQSFQYSTKTWICVLKCDEIRWMKERRISIYKKQLWATTKSLLTLSMLF